MKNFRISGHIDGGVSNLSHLIDLLPDRPGITWSIMWIWAVLNPECEFDYLAFEKKVNESYTGIQMSIREMKCFLNSASQIIDILILGDIELKNIRRYGSDGEMYSKCDYVIEISDGFLYEIHSTDFEFIEKISRLS